MLAGHLGERRRLAKLIGRGLLPIAGDLIQCDVEGLFFVQRQIHIDDRHLGKVAAAWMPAVDNLVIGAIRMVNLHRCSCKN